MSTPTGHESFKIERHGEIAVVTPSAKVEEMHETMIEQAARMVIQSLKSDPPAGIVVDLSQVTYFGSVFVSFLFLISNGALDWGPVKRLHPAADADMVSAERTSRTTVRRVGLEGREGVVLVRHWFSP